MKDLKKKREERSGGVSRIDGDEEEKREDIFQSELPHSRVR